MEGLHFTEPVYSFSEAARILGVHRYTISDLVRGHGITPKRVSTNGLAKGLDTDDLRRLRQAIGLNGNTHAAKTA